MFSIFISLFSSIKEHNNGEVIPPVVIHTVQYVMDHGKSRIKMYYFGCVV